MENQVNEKKPDEDPSKKEEIKPKQEGKENRDNYIYFIDTHDKSRKLKIFLSPEYKGADTLENIQEKDMSQINDTSSTIIYRFKIIPEYLKKEEKKKDYEIIVIAEEENGTQHQYIIKFKDTNKDHYKYDFKIEQVDILPLPYEQQFDFYVEILRKKYKKQQNTIENEDFILSSQTLLIGPNKTYNFLFFLSIFLECFSTKFAYKQLIIFKPEKIKGIGKVSDTKLNQMNRILNVISKNPEKIHLENENDRQKVTELFYSVVLYFNLNLNKEKLAEMFKNEKAFDYLFNKLISFKNLFQGLIIPKNEISKLLESCKSFNHILTFLSYLGKDVNEFLQFIHEKEEFIGNFIDEELNKIEENKENKDKKDNLIISLEDFVEPKKKMI